MKLSFTTLGCPAWDLDTICARGKEYGFDGVDFRGYLGTLDVTTLPMFATHGETTRRQLADAGLAVSGIGTDIYVCIPEKREQNLEEARRTIPTAKSLGAEFMRIFGGGNLLACSRSELAKLGRDTIEEILELDGARDLKWCFETHDQWIKSSDCKLLLDAIPHPAFGALWDMGHTPRVGGEMPPLTLKALAGRVYYTHIKDAEYNPRHPQAMSDGWRYTLPGAGMLPLREAVDALIESGYKGWMVFEHEKLFHPNLPKPEIAFATYARWARSTIGE